MNKRKLSDHLSHLRDYTILDDDIYELFQIRKPEKTDHRKSYSVDTDRRLFPLFQEDKSDKQFSRSIPVLAYTIVTLLAQTDIRKPTHKQMETMLRICGYRGEQMDKYVSENPAMTDNAVLNRELLPVVYLLTRMLREALSDEQKAKNKKQKKGTELIKSPDGTISYDAASPMGRLQKLVAYMLDNSILSLMSDTMEEYEDFVVSFSAVNCRKRIMGSEIEAVERAMQTSEERFARDILRILERAKSKGKQAAISPSPVMMPKLTANDPFAGIPGANGLLGGSGFSHPSAFQMRSVVPSMQSQMPKFDRMGFSSKSPSLDEMKRMLPKDVVAEAEILFDKHNQRIDSFNALADRHAETLDACNDEWERRTGSFYMPAIAEGAFISLLNGDDLYQTNLGTQTTIQIAMNANLPLRLFPIPDLEDKDEWDYAFPEENERRLISEILDEGDTIVQDIGDADLSLRFTLTSVISRIARVPFAGPLVARKSLIKKFREYGFSERKSRDFAVVIATLEYVNDQLHDWEREQKFFEDYYSDGLAGSTTVHAEDSVASIDERIEAAERRAVQAEQEVKRLQQLSQRNRHETNNQMRENERLITELKKAQEEIRKRDELLELYENMPNEDIDDGSPDVQFPFYTDKKIVLYGGFPVFHKELEKYIPGIRVVEHSAHIDVGPVRSADIVFVQINRTSHSNYWNVCDNCRNFDVPFYHLNYASARRCAVEMVEKINKL